MTPQDIRQIRKSLGETQVQFAERLGVGSVTVSRWESGVSTPKTNYHKKKLKELKISVDT